MINLLLLVLYHMRGIILRVAAHSFMAKRNNRIDAHGALRRDVAG